MSSARVRPAQQPWPQQRPPPRRRSGRILWDSKRKNYSKHVLPSPQYAQSLLHLIAPPTPSASPRRNLKHPVLLRRAPASYKPKGVVHSTAGYLLGTALTVKHVFDVHEDDRFACVADVGWITGHSYISTASHERGAGRTHNTGH
ncbi:unnamed protein product [Tilletia controversa]|nr:unnamed protein product [Tilletia controversa]